MPGFNNNVQSQEFVQKAEPTKTFMPKYQTFSNFDEFKNKTAKSMNKQDKKQEELRRREQLR